MKKFILPLAGLAALGLSACGGSSGGGTASTPTPIPTAPTTTPQTPTSSSDSGIQGNIMKVANSRAGVVSKTAATTTVNKVVIDGQAVDFIPSGFTVGKLNMRAGNMDRIGGSSNLAYTRYGYIREGVGGTPYLFAQGVVTNNMPTTGTATYTGQAAHLQNGQVDLVDARFNVNYGTKNLTGTVGTTALSATISGNSFAGTHANGITTTGRFYGNNAAELGGTYSNANGSVAGAYGAKK